MKKIVYKKISKDCVNFFLLVIFTISIIIWVLQAVAMPAVLIETGFISNPEEEDYLNSEDGQREICEVIIRSLKRYKYSLEKQMSVGNK